MYIGGLVVEVEALVSCVCVRVRVRMYVCVCGRGGGGLARHSTSMRWAELIARMFEHRHRAVCGGGLFGFVVDVEEHVLSISL